MKKTFKILVTLVLCIISLPVLSQDIPNTRSIRTISGEDLLIQSKDGLIEEYYLNQELKISTVTFPNNVIENYWMRYNIFDDRIEFAHLENKDQLKIMINDPSLIFTIEDKKFQYLNFSDQSRYSKGIFEIIKRFDDTNVLVKKYTVKTLQPEEKNSSNYSSKTGPDIESETDFYYVENGQISKISNNKRKSTKDLDNSKQDLLNNYIKKNKVKFDDNGKGLSELITYYRSIK